MLRAPTAYDPFINLAAAQAAPRRGAAEPRLRRQAEPGRGRPQKATPVALATKAPPPVQAGLRERRHEHRATSAFFCDYAVNYLSNVAKVSDSELKTGGLKIVTTIDPTIQNSTQKGLSASMPASSPHDGDPAGDRPEDRQRPRDGDQQDATAPTPRPRPNSRSSRSTRRTAPRPSSCSRCWPPCRPACPRVGC